MRQFYCGDQTINRYPQHASDKTYYMLSRYVEVNASFYEDGTPGAMPEMAFAIDSYPDSQLSTKHPVDYIKELPLVEIEDNGYALHRLSSKIAKETRRGMGNVILYNSMTLPKIGRPFHLVYCWEMEPDEYAILYRGEQYFDGPFFVKFKEGHYLYGTHPDWQKYCVRFKLKGQ